MAFQFYVTVKGVKQGDFKGESKKKGFKDKGSMVGLAFEYDIKSPRDVATGQASGKRQHNPIKFVKQWDTSSVQFFTAITTNEVLKEVLFEFISIGETTGHEEIFYTIKLGNAIISEYRQYSKLAEDAAHVTQAGGSRELEEISLVFQTIEVEHKIGKLVGADDWRA